MSKLIVKSNDLIEAKYSFNIWELRVFTKMVSLIKPSDLDFKTYAISISDLANDFDLSNKNIYEIIRQVPDGLLKKIVSIPYKDKKGRRRLAKTPLVSAIDIPLERRDEGVIYLRFDPVLKPFLLQLSERFTTYDLKNVMKLSSPYPFRMYELLKSHAWKSHKSFSISVSDLREFLQLGKKYPRYGHFKSRVLSYCQSELNEHTDLSFTFKEIKQGRRVAEIKFFITLKEQLIIEENADSYTSLKSIGVNNKVALQLIKSYNQRTIQVAVAKAKANKKVKNIAAYVVQALKEEYFKGEPKAKVYTPKKSTSNNNQNASIQEAKKMFEKQLNLLTNQLIEIHLTDRLVERVIEENKNVPFVRKYVGKIKEAKESGVVMAFVKKHLQETYLEKHQINFESWLNHWKK